MDLQCLVMVRRGIGHAILIAIYIMNGIETIAVKVKRCCTSVICSRMHLELTVVFVSFNIECLGGFLRVTLRAQTTRKTNIQN